MSVQFYRKKQGGFLEKSIACQSCGHWSLTERSLSRWSLDLSSRWCALIELFLGVGVGSRIALYRYRTHKRDNIPKSFFLSSNSHAPLEMIVTIRTLLYLATLKDLYLQLNSVNSS